MYFLNLLCPKNFAPWRDANREFCSLGRSDAKGQMADPFMNKFLQTRDQYVTDELTFYFSKCFTPRVDPIQVLCNTFY
jgi:hypothetical protein